VPFIGEAFERIAPAVCEQQARAGDQVLHRARYEDLARFGKGGYPRTGVNGDAGAVLTAHERTVRTALDNAYL